jgi:hypothetical protein
VWTPLRRQKILASPGIQTPGRPARTNYATRFLFITDGTLKPPIFGVFFKPFTNGIKSLRATLLAESFYWGF